MLSRDETYVSENVTWGRRFLYNLPSSVTSVRAFTDSPMLLRVFSNKKSLGQAAAEQAAVTIRRAIAEQGRARIIAATAMSQFEFLDSLTTTPGIDWTKVEAFHLDEYIGLPGSHPGSFRRSLLERLVGRPAFRNYNWLNAERPVPVEVLRRLGRTWP